MSRTNCSVCGQGLVELLDRHETGSGTSKRSDRFVVVTVLCRGLGLFLRLASTLNIDRR